MASTDTTRRGILGAMAIAPAAATLALTAAHGSTPRWDMALASYRAKRSYSDTLDASHPAADDAMDAYCEAMDRLIERTPAPNFDALLIKMELAHERSDDPLLGVFIADLRRLAAH